MFQNIIKEPFKNRNQYQGRGHQGHLLHSLRAELVLPSGGWPGAPHLHPLLFLCPRPPFSISPPDPPTWRIFISTPHSHQNCHLSKNLRGILAALTELSLLDLCLPQSIRKSYCKSKFFLKILYTMNKTHGLMISRHHPFHLGSNPGFGWKKKIWEKQKLGRLFFSTHFLYLGIKPSHNHWINLSSPYFWKLKFLSVTHTLVDVTISVFLAAEV